MALLKNLSLANKSLITSYGTLKFSEEGTVELEQAIAEKFMDLKGFSVEPDKVPIKEVKTENSHKEEAYTDEEVEEVEITEEDLEQMTVKELLEFAKENEIETGKTNKKSELVKLIYNAL